MNRLSIGFALGAVVAAALLISCENKTKPGYGTAPAMAESAVPACAPAGPGSALVTVNGKEITENDLDGKAKAMLISARAKLYEEQKRAVDMYLFDYLLKQEAEQKKVSAEELQKKEIDGRIKKVSDRDIAEFYKERTKGRKAAELPGLDKVKDRIRTALEGQSKGDRKEAYFGELKRKYKVAYNITRPRIPVGTGNRPGRGNEKAPVTIVEFSDFQCPYCKQATQTMDKVMKDYRGKVKLYFRDYPLGFHPNAKPAAVAARCAGEQGKFWEYHDKLFAEQKLSPADYDRYAGELKLDAAKFKTCVASNKFAADVDKDMEDGANLGVTGTPAYFVNGIFLSGALPYEKFKGLLDDEIAAARSAKGGTL